MVFVWLGLSQHAGATPSTTHATQQALQQSFEGDAVVEGAVKVYHVKQGAGLIVLSVGGIDWAKQGADLVLATPERSIATAQVVEIDRIGFAVAQITHWLQPIQPIRKGDVLLARPLHTP